jgi:hypothetical protein
MATEPIDTSELADQLSCFTEDLDARDQRTQLTLFRLLSEGDAVEPGRSAAHAALPDPGSGRCS